jgi:hypothetical protein
MWKADLNLHRFEFLGVNTAKILFLFYPADGKKIIPTKGWYASTALTERGFTIQRNPLRKAIFFALALKSRRIAPFWVSATFVVFGMCCTYKLTHMKKEYSYIML